MDIFNNDIQNKFIADFGFSNPHKTRTPCSNPVFADKTLHRIAIMKDFHLGNIGDIDEGGIPGFVTKSICTGCGKEYKKKHKYFYTDKK